MTECSRQDCPYDPEEFGEVKADIKWIRGIMEKTLGNGLPKRVRWLERIVYTALGGGAVVIFLLEYFK